MVADIHIALADMLCAEQFEPFIRYIRFPHFRNLREGTQIDFDHPITALVGPNGTNKTAILRALQGCPDYYNVGQYWFSTDLDPISDDDRHRFIHSYKARSINQLVQVIKTRINREANPDYFEPSRPLLQDGMERIPELPEGEKMPPERTKTRWKAIKKDVVYLDFRSELSAYDKYFFHVPFDRKARTLAAKKNLIRRRSIPLLESLRTGRSEHSYHRRERIVHAAREVSSTQRKAISKILGREYESIKVIEHRYFEVQGSTVVLKTSALQYSEAFAGSGEFAVAMLVVKVTEAKPSSLILLDEPEVSLHPGAQRELMRFLCEQCKLQRHQIIISTHSPELIRDLPAKAIKVFHSDHEDDKIELVSQSSSPTEAFFRLGFETEGTKTIFVEDVLAAAVVRCAVRPLGQAVNQRLNIVPLPGGTNSIQTRFVPAFALSGRSFDCLILLDGDQAPIGSLRQSSEISDRELEDVLKERLHGEVKLSLDGSAGHSAPGQRISQLRRVYQWVYENLDYLPGDTPETLLLQLEGSQPTEGDDKIIWLERTRTALNRAPWEKVTSAEILGEQERSLARLDQDLPELMQIRKRVQRFLGEES